MYQSGLRSKNVKHRMWAELEFFPKSKKTLEVMDYLFHFWDNKTFSTLSLYKLHSHLLIATYPCLKALDLYVACKTYNPWAESFYSKDLLNPYFCLSQEVQQKIWGIDCEVMFVLFCGLRFVDWTCVSHINIRSPSICTITLIP